MTTRHVESLLRRKLVPREPIGFVDFSSTSLQIWCGVYLPETHRQRPLLTEMYRVTFDRQVPGSYTLAGHSDSCASYNVRWWANEHFTRTFVLPANWKQRGSVQRSHRSAIHSALFYCMLMFCGAYNWAQKGRGESRFFPRFNCSICLIHADLNQKDKNKVVPPLSITWVAVQLHAFIRHWMAVSD